MRDVENKMEVQIAIMLLKCYLARVPVNTLHIFCHPLHLISNSEITPSKCRILVLEIPKSYFFFENSIFGMYAKN